MYLIRLYFNQTVSLNIGKEDNAIIYDVTMGIPADMGVHFANEGGGKYGLVLNQRTPLRALTYTRTSTNYGYEVYWGGGGAVGQQDSQFWIFNRV